MFKDESQLAYARRQFEEFGRCPHVYLISDGEKRYIGSRIGKNCPWDEYWGSYFDDYVWSNLKRRHVLKVFSGDIDSEVVLDFERQMIDLYGAVEDLNFLNRTRCTSGMAAAREVQVGLWPETNGVSPQCIEAAREARKAKWSATNGASPNWIAAGRQAQLEKHPDTNGAPPQWTEAGRKALEEKYPDTNGVSPQSIAAFKDRAVPIDVRLPGSDDWISFESAAAAADSVGYKGNGAASSLLEKLRRSTTGEVMVERGPKKFRGISFRFSLMESDP